MPGGTVIGEYFDKEHVFIGNKRSPCYRGAEEEVGMDTYLIKVDMEKNFYLNGN